MSDITLFEKLSQHLQQISEEIAAVEDELAKVIDRRNAEPIRQYWYIKVLLPPEDDLPTFFYYAGRDKNMKPQFVWNLNAKLELTDFHLDELFRDVKDCALKKFGKCSIKLVKVKVFSRS